MDNHASEDWERIGEELARLRRDGTSLHAQEPVRLFRTADGDFVRVLDALDAPLSPATLSAIKSYTEVRQVESVLRDEGGAFGESRRTPLTATVDVADNDGRDEAAERTTPVGGSQTPTSDVIVDIALNSVATSSEHASESVRSKGDGVAPPPLADLQEPKNSFAEETPDSLFRKSIRVGAWLGESDPGRDITDGASLCHSSDDGPVEQDSTVVSDGGAMVNSIADDTPPLLTLMQQWPRELVERARVCYARRHARTQTSAVRQATVVYWVRNALRVDHGNFALQVAKELAHQCNARLVAVTFVSPSIMYPVRHAKTVNDALSRWSIAEVRRRLHDRGIPLFGFTPKTRRIENEQTQTHLEAGRALFQLFDAFAPVAVVADEGFSTSSRLEVNCVGQHLNTRTTAAWSLVAVDSMSCVPLYRLAESARNSLSSDSEDFVRELEFGNEYSQQIGSIVQLSTTSTRAATDQNGNRAAVQTLPDSITIVLQALSMDEINWEVVEAMNAQSTHGVAISTESAAQNLLSALLGSTDDRPAIQQELQGAGIMSLLPYIRHGTLFAGFVLDKLAAAIAATPRPTDAKSRKAFATLKVLRSRALTHLGKERDYALYLSLWASQRAEREPQLTGRVLPFCAIASFQGSTSELDTYKHILPTWISASKCLHDNGPMLTATYDPYQLESGRTDDQYWNEIQLFMNETRYLHPLVIVYWAFRILQWSVSTQAAVATIESQLDKCSLGSSLSPDAIFAVWNAIFGLGKAGKAATSGNDLALRVQEELANQPQLHLRK